MLPVFPVSISRSIAAVEKRHSASGNIRTGFRERIERPMRTKEYRIHKNGNGLFKLCKKSGPIDLVLCTPNRKQDGSRTSLGVVNKAALPEWLLPLHFGASAVPYILLYSMGFRSPGMILLDSRSRI